MEENNKIILILFILGLLAILWSATRSERQRDICEGMTQQECEAYQEVMGGRDKGY